MRDGEPSMFRRGGDRRGLWANLAIAAMVLILAGAVALARQAEGRGQPAPPGVSQDGSA